MRTSTKWQQERPSSLSPSLATLKQVKKDKEKLANKGETYGGPEWGAKLKVSKLGVMGQCDGSVAAQRIVPLVDLDLPRSRQISSIPAPEGPHFHSRLRMATLPFPPLNG